MLGRIKEFFQGQAVTLEVDKSGGATNKDLQIATGVLLLEMAGADDDFAPEEVQAVFAAMEKQFSMTDSEALEILESADQARNEKEKIDQFVAVINENFDDKQKLLIMAMAWKIIVADEIIENYEKRFATQLRVRLQLSKEQAEEAKQIALEGRV